MNSTFFHCWWTDESFILTRDKGNYYFDFDKQRISRLELESPGFSDSYS
jgi:hypothetical protein